MIETGLPLPWVQYLPWSTMGENSCMTILYFQKHAKIRMTWHIMLKVWALTLFSQRLEPVNRLTDSGQSRAGTGRSGHAVGEWAWGHTTASPTAGLEMWATKSRKVYPEKSDMFRRSVLPWVPRLITGGC